VRILQAVDSFKGARVYKTRGRHGSVEAYAAIGETLGEVCGVVFEHPNEKTLFIAGDTIWCEDVQKTLQAYQPGVVVMNCGDAQIPGIGSILMGKENVLNVHEASPQSILVASHMEAVNHCTLTRNELIAFAGANGIEDVLLVPADGEAYEFTAS
jgi:L-ascorbate metabolism protein UlaG (beta-lactamase superfamily)